ncbi:MAG TPA: MraY family glycosyltransferase [Candidatus Krumholzibacteria bacterium]|nr:MraY family glycosyltransferase [Candidatus Krumholzibacteria bacterium]
MRIGWLLLAFCAGTVITWAVRNLSRRAGMLAHPGEIVPQHRVPVAHTGGIAIALTVLLVTLVAQFLGANRGGSLIPAHTWIPALLFLGVGVTDDLRPLSAVPKLILQTAVAIIAVTLELRWHLTGNRLLDSGITIAWLVLLVNAFNVTDVCDGLVAGMVVIMLTFAGARTTESWLSLTTVGATLGFLVFNRPPASIFLGDGGSHLLGFVVAASLLTVAPSTVAAPWKYAASAAVATGVVLLEVALLVYSRAKAGIPWWRGSAHHFSLRLQARGLSRLATDAMAWMAATVLCVVAWYLPLVSNVVAVAATLAVALALAAAGRLLLRWEPGR